MPRAPLLLALLIGLSACATAPDLGTPAPASQATPTLVPLTPLLSRPGREILITSNTIPALRSRVTRLRARAAAMRSTALTDADRDRIRRALDRIGNEGLETGHQSG